MGGNQHTPIGANLDTLPDLSDQCGKVNARPWEELTEALAHADVILSTTGATEPVILPAMVEKAVSQRKGKPLFMLDIAVPRDIHPDVAKVKGVFVFGLDDLDEIIALDAQTLQLRHRFGLGLLYGVLHLAVVGDELYAGDTGNDRLQVFSLTGEHRRSITGEWRSPESLCFAKDRLYLVERPHPAFPLQGSRLLVLSLQGDLLQVVTHPTEPTAVFHSICCFDRKLLASYRCREPAGPPWKCGVLALQGL